MQANRPRKLFVNLPVRDLKRTVEFWQTIGFEFNAQFCDDSAACMMISDGAFAMLMVEPRFKDFARKPLGDARTQTAGIFSLEVDSRADVDALVKAAIAAGGSAAAEPIDHGFMYCCSFYDLDGHHWESFYMDASACPG